ncbi:uncharacterized protein LOC105235153, partial [Ailuropoda melanoleuca]|uniref:uncharacterized protein LOC105235153 n=1 Tax=Ailuropoda melanoleuca TaxID=9646 RepID=UPI00149503E7
YLILGIGCCKIERQDLIKVSAVGASRIRAKRPEFLRCLKRGGGLFPTPTAASVGIFRGGGTRALRRTVEMLGRAHPGRLLAVARAAGGSGETAAVAAADRGPGRAQRADTSSGGCGCRCRRFCCCCSCCCWCRCRLRRAGGTSMSVRVCVRGRVCVRVCVCVCGDSGPGGSGSPGGGAAATAARPRRFSLRWFGAGAILCDLQNPLGKKPPPPSAPGRAARPRRRESGSGDFGICWGGGCRLPGPGRHWNRGAGERLRRLRLGRGAGSAGGGERRPGRERSGGSPRLRLTEAGRAEGGACHFRRRRRGPGAAAGGRNPTGPVPEERRVRAEGKLRRVGAGAEASREPGPGGRRKRQTFTGRPSGGEEVVFLLLLFPQLLPRPSSSVPTSVGTAGVLRKDNAQM